ncbi:MAG: hypothetical protein NTV61_04590 [Candidatus Bathyarchaeota archaeon]|nr:hypothetical protein [Candidatus Bathyarchaeota archaeon]
MSEISKDGLLIRDDKTGIWTEIPLNMRVYIKEDCKKCSEIYDCIFNVLSRLEYCGSVKPKKIDTDESNVRLSNGIIK